MTGMQVQILKILMTSLSLHTVNNARDVDHETVANCVRVDNVRHNHMIFMIRDTDFREKIPTLQVKTLPRVLHIHYRAKKQ